MARLQSRKTILKEIAALQEKLKEHDKAQAERIGRLALRSGLATLDIPEASLMAEFEILATRFRQQAAAEPQQTEEGSQGEGSEADGIGDPISSSTDASDAEAATDPAPATVGKTVRDRAA